LHNAADDLKQLPAGHVLEIAGYTGNTGNPAENIALSQRRAEAVRDALIKDGANPDMLVAKGYGSADSIASNDTPEGRLRNRRIEYHILKTP
jgi:outer membrane protein OmpA-like peptidoglycan-associated protein